MLWLKAINTKASMVASKSRGLFASHYLLTKLLQTEIFWPSQICLYYENDCDPLGIQELKQMAHFEAQDLTYELLGDARRFRFQCNAHSTHTAYLFATSYLISQPNWDASQLFSAALV